MLLPAVVVTIALLYDVHGNLPALQAVLDDARAEAAARFVLGGDYALFGPWPVETVRALRELSGATWIRGNGERWTAGPAQAPQDEVIQGAIHACVGALGQELVDELARLPEDVVLNGTRYCHGSPVSDVRSFMPEASEDDEELLGGIVERRLVFGHTHVPFRRIGPGAVELVNPGSVGMPFDGDPCASYALLHPSGELEHRRVAYDHEASAAAVRERFDGADWTEAIARRIATATM
jgi:diadenosine tetraphosphatase ApaH/serine/threonine PP2A family protein phosphatase